MTPIDKSSFLLFEAPSEQAIPNRSSPNNLVILDKAWAHLLGVRRQSGVYRIRRAELNRRLAGLNEELSGVSPARFGSWHIDPAHTSVGFVASHLMVAKVRGGFRSVSGTIEVAPAVEDSSVEVTVDAASIDTGEPKRDEHLRSRDFLDVDNHPHLRFRSTRIQKDGERRGKMTGDLTIRGVTRPVTLDVEYLGGAKDPGGHHKLAFEASAQINREDFGLVWNQILEAGGILVGKEVGLRIHAQAHRPLAAAG